ncbi:hypothetical protein Tco_0424664 [Tanacetum coccineum]
MDSIISLGQKNTLAEYMILSGADNRPPMLDKDLYDSWKSRMELYMQNREHRRMILESVEHGPLIWPTVEENDVIRTKKYVELSAAKKIQADCDMKATNIILQGLPADIYSLVNHHRVAKIYRREFSYYCKLINDMNIYKMKMEQFQVNTKFLNSLPPEWSKFVTDVKLVKDLHTSNFDQLHAYLEQHELHANEVRFAVPVFSPGDDPIACLNKAMAFLTVVASSRFPSTNNQLRTSFNLRNQATIQDSRVTVQQVLGRQGQNYSAKRQGIMQDPRIPAGQAQTIIPHNASFQTEDLDTYDSDCDDLSTHKRFLWPTFPIMDFEQSPVMDFTDNKISSDSNIIPYSQYLQETQQETVQDTNLQAQQDSMILSVIEQMSEQMINHVNNWEKANKEQNNETITAELERYKERNLLKEQIDSLEQNLSKQIKKKESLFKTFTVFKNEYKEKENKYMENEIDLEKKIKELDNIIYKVGQSAQTVHMLIEPQSFYDNTHKQALGYHNPFYLRKAQRIKPTLYDGVVMSNTYVAMLVIDDEETLILEENSRSKMSEKVKDPEVIAKKISHKPIDYEKLNRLTEDFGKKISPQQELSAEQAFWFHIVNPSIESSYTPPVIVDIPNELPKVSLVNASLKKLKFHLTQFDSVVKKRTTPNALEEGEWGFEHTKTVFNNEIIPFLKSLKDIFNVFDKDLLNEIKEVQTVFDQMDTAVQQSLVDKQCLEIAKKEILLENDRLLQKITSQDVLLTVINFMSWNNDSVNIEMQTCDSCEKCLNLDAELSKSKQSYNDLLKNYSQLEKHCISLEVSMQLKQEVFQNDESCVNHNGVEIQEYFEINDLKARLQDNDTTICKLKDIIKSMREKSKDDNVNNDLCELETKNVDLENSVAKLLSENERLCKEINHLKQVFKDQFDSIKKTRVRTKEQSDSLIDQLNLKFAENEDLKAQIQDKELLVYVQDTCPNAITHNTRKVAVTPMNNVKKVRFAEPLTSSRNSKQVESSNTSDSNTLVLSSTRLKCSTRNCRSKPLDNKKNDRISQTPSRNKKNKVEAQPRKVNNSNRFVKLVCDVDVKHSLSNTNSEILCAT